MDPVADGLTVGQPRIEPGRQTLLIQDQRHARVYRLVNAAGELGEDDAAGLAARPLRPDTGERKRFAVLAGQVMGLLASLLGQPLIQAVGRYQAAVMGEGVSEVG